MLDGGVGKFLNERSLHLYGNGTWPGAGSVNGSNGGLFCIHDGATLTLLSDADFTGGVNATLRNEGIFTKSGGGGTSQVSAYFDNLGEVRVMTGTVYLVQDNPLYQHSGAFAVSSGATLQIGSDQTFAAASSIQGEGEVRFSGGSSVISGTYHITGTTTIAGGTSTFNSAQPITTTSLVQTSGTLDGSSDLVVTDIFTWTYGTQRGSGTTTIPTSASLVLDGGVGKFLNERSLHLYGNGTWPGAGSVNGSNGGLFYIHDGATLTLLSDADFTGGVNATLRNEGIFTKSGGDGTSQVSAYFDNLGEMRVMTGTVYLVQDNPLYQHSGAFAVSSGATLQIGSDQTFAAASSIQGEGEVRFSRGSSVISGTYHITGTTTIAGGTSTFNSAQPITTTSLVQTSGTLDGSSDLVVTDVFTWTYGTQRGSGTTTIPTSASLVLDGGVGKSLNERSLHLYGNGTWPGAGSVNGSNGGLFYIHDGATLTLLSDADFTGGVNATLRNEGIFTKSGGDGTSQVSAYFDNLGEMRVMTGTVYLVQDNPLYQHSGAFAVSSGATLQIGSDQTFAAVSSIQGEGEVRFSGGSSVISGTYHITGTTTIAGGTVNLDAATSVAFGNLTQSTGNLYLDTAASITGNFSRTGGTFNAGAGGTLSFNGTSQNLELSNFTTFRNLSVSSGTILVETNPVDNCVVNGSLTNNGIIRKTQAVVTGTVSYGMTGVQMDVTTLGSLSSVTVDRVDADHPNATGSSGENGISTGRYWTITGTGTGYTLTLTLPHANLPEPKVCRYTGTDQIWECDRTSYDASTVTWANRTTFSDWAVGTNVGPTAIHLVRITAGLVGERAVEIGFLVLAGTLLVAMLVLSRRSIKVVVDRFIAPG